MLRQVSYYVCTQGAAFIRKDAGDYLEYCWDKTSDDKFEVKEPEAKKKKTEE